MDTVSIALMVSICFALVNFLRYLKGADWNGAFTIASVWVAGIAAVTLAAQSDLGNINVDAFLGTEGATLGTLNFATQVILGFAIGSAATVGDGLLGAIDNTRSTNKPTLFGSDGGTGGDGNGD